MQFFGALKDQIGWWHLRRRACNGGGGLRLFAWPETLLSDSCLSGRNTQKFRDHFVRLAGRGVEEVRPGIGGGRRRANGVRQGGGDGGQSLLQLLRPADSSSVPGCSHSVETPQSLSL